MASPAEPGPGHGAAQRLRSAIDRGLAGDKVDNIDPAAAPLGTDDEAAGQIPQQDGAPASVTGDLQPEPGRSTHRGGGTGVVIWLAVVLGAVAAVTAFAIFL